MLGLAVETPLIEPYMREWDLFPYDSPIDCPI